jgi:F-type H+-transporting ATPase subunit b
MEFLNDTDIVVAIAFVIFIGILIYFGVPRIVGNILDARADKIKAEIDEAASLREEARSLLASYERKQKDVQAQADRIVATAREEAQAAAVRAKADIERSIARRLKAAEDQILSAEASATKEVRDRAVAVAISAARETIARNLAAKDAGSLIDTAIDEIGAKLH